MSRSWVLDVVLRPFNGEFLVSSKHSGDPGQSRRNILHIQPRGLPIKFQVAPSVVAYLDNDLGLNDLVVPDIQSHIGLVAAHIFPCLFLWGWRRRHYDDGRPIIVGVDNSGRWGRRSGESLGLDNNLVSSDIEGISGVQSDSLVFRSVVNPILSDELEGAIIFVFFEHSDCPLWKSNPQFVLLRVFNIYFVGGLPVSLIVCPSADTQLIVFSDLHPKYLGDELYLLLGFVIESHWVAESVEMEVGEGFRGKCRSLLSSCRSCSCGIH